MESRELHRRFLQHSRVGDRIPSINRLGLVTGHSHRSATGYPSTFKITDRGPAEVMDKPAGDARSFASVGPRAAEVLDCTSVRMNKNPRDHAGMLTLDCLDH